MKILQTDPVLPVNRSLLVKSLITIFVAFPLVTASGAIFNIADGDVDGLKAAIVTANANGEDDTIELAANGTYTVATIDHNFSGGTGLPAIESDGGRKLRLHGNGASLERSSAPGTPSFRIFHLDVGADVTLSHLTIANGMLVDPCCGSYSSGAAIVNAGAALVVDHCNFIRNSVSGGYYGGAISNLGLNSLVATLVVVNCNFIQNGAGSGGAIYNEAYSGTANSTITMSAFGENHADNDGGAIAGISQFASVERLTVVNCTFSQNTAGTFPSGGRGGAVSNFNYESNSDVTITNSTFSRNTAVAGDSIHNLIATPQLYTNTFRIGNTILESGSSGRNIDNAQYGGGLYGAMISLGYNLSDDDGSGYLNQSTDQINTNPMLDPAGLQNNGGPTQTIALQPGSPAMDRGKDMDADGNPAGVDQRGAVRPFDASNVPNAVGGDGSDIGAFELGSAPPGTPTPVGTNVTVDCGMVGSANISLTFSEVTSAGGTSVALIDPASAGTLPPGYQLAGGDLAFDITTTAAYVPPILLAFRVPSLDPVTFSQLRVLHNEGGSLIDVTASDPSPDPVSQTIYASVNSLSPFVLAKRPTPTPTPTPSPSPGNCQLTTSITSNFNGTKINQGNYIWFSSVLKASGIGSTPVTIRFTNQTISSSGSSIAVPDAMVTFDPAATSATTSFTGGIWVTRVPAKLAGNMFLSGTGYPVPVNLPGGIKNVKWNATTSIDRPGVKFNWQWGAAVYKSFSTDYNALGVKPVDDKKASQYKNADHAGAPENYKSQVTGGATGGGGSNYTGNLTGAKTVGPCPH